MAKKYLTLEEAAARLALSKDALVKLREAGTIRGFADRGNWKFKIDDVEELARSRQADSDPDVRIAPEPESGGSGVLDEGPRSEGPGDSSLVMAPGDSGPLEGGSEVFGEGVDETDSDVRLVMDSDLTPDAVEDSDSDINLVADSDDSDSDVKLAPEPDSDSDVKLVDSQDDSDSDVSLADTTDSDSDIQLAAAKQAKAGVDEPTDSDVALVADVEDSDSDIRLSAEDLGATDSDVRLVTDDPGSDITLSGPDQKGSDSDVRLVADPEGEGSDSDVQLIDSTGTDSKTSDSDIALISSDDSAIAIDLGEPELGSSVLTEESSDKSQDSSMTLASESGISLEGPTDSGISLDLDFDEGITLAEDEDSGISIGDAGDSGIALASDSDSAGGGTMPMMGVTEQDDVAETQFEIPSLGGEESDFEIAGSDDGDTSIVDLDDDSDDQTALLDVMDDSGELDDAVFDVDEADSEEMDSLSDELELDEDFDEDSEMDVFEDDGDFEEGFQSGESHGDFAIPTRATTAVEAEWGTGVFSALIGTTALLTVLGVMMADLVRSMWGWNEPNMVAGPLLDFFAGLF